MSVRVDHRDRERFSRHSSRASVDLAFPSGSSRDHSFRSVHSARVPRVASDDLMVPVRPLRSASCRVAPGAPQRLRRHHSSAAECERARRSRRHTLELPGQRAASVRSRSPEPPPPPEPELPPEEASKEARRRRVVTAVAASFFALALASVLVVVVTLTHSSVLRAHNQTANTAGERAADARRPSGGNLKSHPVVGGIALTPRYSPRPRLDNARPPAAPPAPEETDQEDPLEPEALVDRRGHVSWPPIPLEPEATKRQGSWRNTVTAPSTPEKSQTDSWQATLPASETTSQVSKQSQPLAEVNRRGYDGWQNITPPVLENTNKEDPSKPEASNNSRSYTTTQPPENLSKSKVPVDSRGQDIGNTTTVSVTVAGST